MGSPDGPSESDRTYILPEKASRSGIFPGDGCCGGRTWMAGPYAAQRVCAAEHEL
jgi:hypothetical protein